MDAIENKPYDRLCDVDGCRAIIVLTRLPDGYWRVQHGFNPESSRVFSREELFVTTGYRPWARTVHAYADEFGERRSS